MVDVLLFVVRPERLETCFVRISMVMSILKLVYVSQVWEVFPIHELSGLQLPQTREDPFIRQVNLHYFYYANKYN